MSGFFLVRRACLENIPFQRAGFKLLLEVLVRGRLRSVEEVPFVFGLRYRGASKASVKVGSGLCAPVGRLYASPSGLLRKN